jgi:hypothetical protein
VKALFSILSDRVRDPLRDSAPPPRVSADAPPPPLVQELRGKPSTLNLPLLQKLLALFPSDGCT